MGFLAIVQGILMNGLVIGIVFSVMYLFYSIQNISFLKTKYNKTTTQMCLIYFAGFGTICLVTIYGFSVALFGENEISSHINGDRLQYYIEERIKEEPTLKNIQLHECLVDKLNGTCVFVSLYSQENAKIYNQKCLPMLFQQCTILSLYKPTLEKHPDLKNFIYNIAKDPCAHLTNTPISMNMTASLNCGKSHFLGLPKWMIINEIDAKRKNNLMFYQYQ